MSCRANGKPLLTSHCQTVGAGLWLRSAFPWRAIEEMRGGEGSRRRFDRNSGGGGRGGQAEPAELVLCALPSVWRRSSSSPPRVARGGFGPALFFPRVGQKQKWLLVSSKILGLLEGIGAKMGKSPLCAPLCPKNPGRTVWSSSFRLPGQFFSSALLQNDRRLNLERRRRSWGVKSRRRLGSHRGDLFGRSCS